ncbi:MAG: sulfite exporter TauE/SafE family protein [Proteobacteria bacterium]|nr:sulfite exporter TauE/SafE family protein [Pseudomonadota bacterium]
MDPATLLYAVVCVLVAAVVRGFTGFGFSMLAITALAIVLPPREVVPAVFLLELAASVQLLAAVWRDIHWRPLAWLLVGCLLGTPPGVHLLAVVPAAPMTAALALTVFVAALVLARGHSLAAMPGRAATIATGAASGALNGGIGIGGPPVILFFFGSPIGIAAGRASMIAYFVATDVMALAWQATEGLLTVQSLRRALVLAPVMLAGVWIGSRAFARADPGRYRSWVLRLLMVLAVIAGIHAVAQLR